MQRVNMREVLEEEKLLKKSYRQKIRDYVTKGYVRRLTKTEAAQTSPHTWYLPHFSVVNPNKPGKMRFVFDAAAMVDKISLNSMLLSGRLASVETSRKCSTKC